MGASRKLQGEIDRVLKKVQEGVELFDGIWNKVYDTENANQKEKFEADLKKEIKKLQRYRDQIKTWIQSSEIKDKKVSASYEQALMDARRQIEREMERFKVCEKETKTKAFSKEGLGQQPKTDPKEKAKSETREWLNNVVGDLESQIDEFEAELEGLSIKKGKARPPRLTHLETSITRHKSHIKKLESILRLLDNDELSPDQVNDVKDFLEDYVERNQDDFDEFSDVDELYSSLPLDKVEALEDMVSLGPSSLVKAAPSLSPTQGITQDQVDEIASQDSSSDVVPRTPPSKNGTGTLVSAASSDISSATLAAPLPTITASSALLTLGAPPTSVAMLSGSTSVRGGLENTSAPGPSLSNPGSLKEDDNVTFPGRRPSPAIPEIGIGRGVTRVIANQTSVSSPMSLNSAPGNGALGSVPAISDLTKRNMLNSDERIGSGLVQPLVSPLGNRMLLQQVSRANDGISISDSNNASEGAVIGGRVLSPSVVSGVQWRPQTTASFQNQNEMNQLRGRPEIAPDQREKFLQRLQQVQQGHGSLLNVSQITGANQKQYPPQQQNPLLQQFNSQSSSISPQVSMGLAAQVPGAASVTSTPQQQLTSILQQPTQHTLVSSVLKDGDGGHIKMEEQQQQSLTDDLSIESPETPGVNKSTTDDDLKNTVTSTVNEGNQLPRDSDLSPGQPLQSSLSSASVGVIGRRSASDLGAIGDNLSGTPGTSGGIHDHNYNLQMLEAAYYKLPQPKDSERLKSYVPRHHAVTPSSYPQTQAPLVASSALWERLGLDSFFGTDALFFAFYYQQNTYQQYLAARELKRQSWRYHRKHNTWFQRHEEPKVTTDEFERGSYVYFDFRVTDDGSGWCQRIKTDFTFEYNYLEDELPL